MRDEPRAPQALLSCAFRLWPTQLVMTPKAPPDSSPNADINLSTAGESASRTGGRDDLFASPLSDPGLFRFDASVASVFPDMINRSVPGYATVVGMTGTLAAQHARPGSHIYDLGCSWGASLLSVAREPACKRCELIGIDISESMLEQASSHLAQFPEANRIELQHADILLSLIHI